MNREGLRKCEVGKDVAFFHRWSEHATVVDPSPMIGGHPGGAVKFPVGIVEYADGTVKLVEPGNIKFIV